MKERYLAGLCRDHWDKDRAEVAKLRLTPASQRELTQDILGPAEGAPSVIIDQEGLRAGVGTSAGAIIGTYVHPVTGRAIPVITDAAFSRDTIVLEREVPV